MIDNDLPETHPDRAGVLDLSDEESNTNEEIAKLQNGFQARLVAANLRTEAVRAGMIDLDGLKLVDLSMVQLDTEDKVVGGRKLMDDLRRSKPWLFIIPSSSSSAVAPSSHPTRPKTAMDMTDEEYTIARTALTKY